MEATKGIHGILTAVFGLLLFWVTWDFWQVSIMGIADGSSFADDPVLLGILWGSYIIMVIIIIGVIPALIALSRDGQATSASILSAGAAFGVWVGGVYLVRFLRFFFGIFLDDFGTNPALTNSTALLADGSIHNQWMSFVWLLLAVTFLYIVPIIVGVAPDMFGMQSAIADKLGIDKS